MLIGLLLAGSIIFFSSNRQRNTNLLLTGRWLVSLKGSPNAQRYLEISPDGNVTAYKLDGVTIDTVPGWRETWTLRGDVIEFNGEYRAPTKPLLTTIRELRARMLASQRKPQREPNPSLLYSPSGFHRSDPQNARFNADLLTDEQWALLQCRGNGQ